MIFSQDIMMHDAARGTQINIKKIIQRTQIFTIMQMEILELLIAYPCGKKMVQRVFIVVLIALIYFQHLKIVTLFTNIIKVKQLKAMSTT